MNNERSGVGTLFAVNRKYMNLEETGRNVLANNRSLLRRVKKIGKGDDYISFFQVPGL